MDVQLMAKTLYFGLFLEDRPYIMNRFPLKGVRNLLDRCKRCIWSSKSVWTEKAPWMSRSWRRGIIMGSSWTMDRDGSLNY